MELGAEGRVRLDEEVARAVSVLGIPGLALAVTDRERTLAVATHGLANVDARTRVRPETLFQIGSVAKSFAALAALREVEEGRLDLGARLTEYLPWFRLRSGTEDVTLHGLLSHTSGLPPGMDPTPSSLGEVLVLARADAGTPGRFRYSNVGYTAAGLVLERVTGLRIDQVLRRSVLEPAGMAATEATLTNTLRPRSAVGYAPIDDDRAWDPSAPLAPAPWVESDSAAGSISSTPDDMAAYARVLLNRGRGVVSEDSFETMISPASGLDENHVGYGYGIAVEQLPGNTWIGHSGTTVGFSAFLDVDLTGGISVVALCNLAGVEPFVPQLIAARAREVVVAASAGREPAEATWPAPVAPAKPANTPAGERATAERWRAFPGHYRSHSPWSPGFWIVAREDGLALRLHGATEAPLLPAGDGAFTVEDDIEGPLRIEFGDVIDGMAARATCDGTDLYRVPW